MKKLQVGSHLIIRNISYGYSYAGENYNTFAFRDEVVEFDGTNIVTKLGLKLKYSGHRIVRKGSFSDKIVTVDLDPLSKFKVRQYKHNDYTIDYGTKEEVDEFFKRREAVFFQDMIENAKKINERRDELKAEEIILKEYHDLVAKNDLIRNSLLISETKLYNRLVRNSNSDIDSRFNKGRENEELIEQGHQKLYVEKFEV